MARNVIGGRSKAVLGIKELAVKLNELAAIADGTRNSDIRRRLHRDVLAPAAGRIADKARANARAAGWPRAAVSSIFSVADPDKTKPKKPGALVGVNKQQTMVEWTATVNPKSPRAKVGPGGKVAMSKASMFEFGTSRMSPRPAFRPAVTSERAGVRDDIADGLRNLIEDIVKS